MARIRIGIDTGGTFTDVVAVDEEHGTLTTTKTPSTPRDPAEAFLTGVHAVLQSAGATGADVLSVSHGTTVATNQLLQGKITGLGFITTEGYESMLEIARQSVPDGYGNSYFWVKPDRIVPADLVRAVGGRLDFRGAEIRPFDEAGAVAAARWFRERGISTIGVCFLHSYAEPDHERRMREILAREHPEAVVSISSDVLREYREYERSMTTLVDAAVKPTVAAYVARVHAALTRLAPQASFTIMRSSGGVLSADEVVRQPISTVLSGPAAGALGAAYLARQAGHERVLTLDGGGTSTDVSVVRYGEPALTTDGDVGGYPSKIPMIDVVTVGAGGGSIAAMTAEGTLAVGPHSAGADPGPLCYGRGGAEPTVTDAHLVLGRIPPHLLGGQVPLDVSPARAGIAVLADKLGIGLAACANGVLEISAWNQANALRQITVQRGLDVRDFALVTFGGSGPLLLCRLMDILALPAAVVPSNPGNVSAFGLLTVDVRSDDVRTYVSRHDALDLDRLQVLLDELITSTAATLHGEGFAVARHRYLRSADLRYFGQASELAVPVPEGPVTRELADTVAAGFHDAHEALYGYSFRRDPSQQVEWVNLRVRGVGPIDRPPLVRIREADDVAAPSGRRAVDFGDATGSRATDLYQRADLRAGHVVRGPAVVEEFGSTVPVHPGFQATVDGFGNLVVARTAA